MAYKVEGGVHTDLTFSEVEKGKEESYGPFESRQDAIQAWKASVWANVDNALHRMKLIEV